MRLTRALVLLVALVVIALGLVHLRAEQTRSAARLLRMESEWIAVRRDLWALQARTARLRSPQRILDRLEHIESDLVPPGFVYQPGQAGRLTSHGGAAAESGTPRSAQ